MYNKFKLDEPFLLHLDPPSAEEPTLCCITQEGKDPIITTDFYLTYVEPKPLEVPSQPENKDTSSESQGAAAADPHPDIQPDPLQPGEIRLYSWMLLTPQAPVQFWIYNKDTLHHNTIYERLFSSYNCVQSTIILILKSTCMAEESTKRTRSPSNQMPDSDTSENEHVDD